MRRFSSLIVGVFMAMLLIAPVNAASKNTPAYQKAESDIQTPDQPNHANQVAPKYSGPTSKDKVMERRAIKERALQRRNVEMKKGAQPNNGKSDKKTFKETGKTTNQQKGDK